MKEKQILLNLDILDSLIGKHSSMIGGIDSILFDLATEQLNPSDDVASSLTNLRGTHYNNREKLKGMYMNYKNQLKNKNRNLYYSIFPFD